MSDRQDSREQRPASGDPDAEARGAWPFDRWVRLGLRQVWRLIILIVGGTVVLLGLVMLVTPGPALIVVPVGLAILAIEFAWARRMLHRVRARAAQVQEYYKRGGR